MMYSPSDSRTMQQDWDILPIDTVTLSDPDIENAIQLSSSIPKLERQWLAYRHALALAGFRQWLRSRSPHLTLHTEICSLHQPAIASLVESVCQLWVNDMRICLLAIGSMDDTVVSIPRAVLDIPDYAAHIYIVVNVLEEQQQVQVRGYSTYPQLRSRLNSGEERHDTQARSGREIGPEIEPENRPEIGLERSAWTYEMDSSAFVLEVDRLLLLLEGLDPSSMPLPYGVAVTEEAIATLASRLNQLWPQLRDPEIPLEQILSGQDVATILQSVEQRNWLYQLQTGQEPMPLRPIFQQAAPDVSLETASDAATNIGQGTEQPSQQPLTQPIINVGQWFQDQLDQVAQDLSWVLMPPLSALRGLRSRWEPVVQSLRTDGIAIDAQARGAYQDIDLDEVALRLYAITWPLEMNEWALLLVLGTVPGTSAPGTIPSGTSAPGTSTSGKFRLMVYDHTQCLVDRQWAASATSDYVYGQVVGDRHESFWVVIDSGVGHPIALPPFSFMNAAT